MSYDSSRHDTSNVRAVMQPRRPAGVSKIEKARDPRRAMKGLLRYLTPYKVGLVVVLILVIIYTLLGLAGPYLMGVAIDQYIAVKRLDGLALIALMMLTVYILNNLFQAIASWVMAIVSQSALKRMRQDLFQHLQTLPLSFFDRNPAGETIAITQEAIA